MVDVDAPLDIAQYAEGQRFVVFCALDKVPDNDKECQGWAEASPAIPLHPDRSARWLAVRLRSGEGLHLEYTQAPLRNRLPRTRPRTDCLP
jgi:hypothetical protein